MFGFGRKVQDLRGSKCGYAKVRPDFGQILFKAGFLGMFGSSNLDFWIKNPSLRGLKFDQCKFEVR